MGGIFLSLFLGLNINVVKINYSLYIYLRDSARAYLIHDKSINECKYIRDFTESVGFIPRKITNEYVLTWYEHGELENYITEDMLDENNRKKFRELLKTKEEMNPIIVKYYFK